MKTTLLCLAASLALMHAQAPAQSPPRSFAIVNGDGPIITDGDIVEYRFAEHAMKIQGESVRRMARMKPSVSGSPFQVMVDGVPVYSGRFVSMVSSMSFKEPTILPEVSPNDTSCTLFIRGPYCHEPQFQTGIDPRIDVRITRTLAALGKLRAGTLDGACREQSSARSSAAVLVECQKVVVGMTRAELMKMFEGEGGLSNARHRTFVHRSNPYVKLDVQFTLSDPKQSAVEERPTDTISKASKPYLGWSILD